MTSAAPWNVCAAQAILDLVPEMAAMRSWADLLQSGGVRRWERDAVAAAKQRALEVTRKMWLEVLERWRRQWYERFANRKPRARDFDEIVYIAMEIRSLRPLACGRPGWAVARRFRATARRG
jgi:hypothetical protein